MESPSRAPLNARIPALTCAATCAANAAGHERTELQKLTDWLIDGARSAGNPAEMMAETCERLVQAGLPLWRVGVFVRTLHPDIYGRNFVWRPGAEVEVGTVDFKILECAGISGEPAGHRASGRAEEVRGRLYDPAERPLSDLRRHARRRRHRLYRAAAAVHRRHRQRLELDHETAGRLHRRAVGARCAQ